MKHSYDSKSLWNIGEIRRLGGRYSGRIFFGRLLMRFFWKRSEVETEPLEVVYRRRKFHWLSSRCPCFIDCHIRNVEKIEEDIDNSIWVQGRIIAVYLYEDGETEHHIRELRKAVIPSCFKGMSEIKKALETLQTET